MRSVSRRTGAGKVAVAMCVAASIGLPGVAAAVDFPVSGTITVDGQSGTLPEGGAFAGSGYDPASGSIASGAFAFPVTIVSREVSGGTVAVTYQLSQVDTSSGQVASDGVAALSVASMKLAVLSATYNGFPIPVAPCEFQPILIELAGTGDSDGLALADSQFDIPPAPVGNCGAFRDQINGAFAGSDNAIIVQMAGDFTPPSDQDTIFVDGFDTP